MRKKGCVMKSGFIKTGLIAVLLPLSVSAWALSIEPYTPEKLLKRQNAGEVVSLSFFAKWCSTCLMQEKVFQSFKGDASVPGTLLVADYDQSRQIMKKLRVSAQSTLIVFKGPVEIHRSGGITDPRVLRATLQSAH
jgi:thiol-disulfide isomerase/thioredoxin